jgi:hypothetical protein
MRLIKHAERSKLLLSNSTLAFVVPGIVPGNGLWSIPVRLCSELELRYFLLRHRGTRLCVVHAIGMQLSQPQAVRVLYALLALISDDQPVDGDETEHV